MKLSNSLGLFQILFLASFLRSVNAATVTLQYVRPTGSSSDDDIPFINAATGVDWKAIGTRSASDGSETTWVADFERTVPVPDLSVTTTVEYEQTLVASANGQRFSVYPDVAGDNDPGVDVQCTYAGNSAGCVARIRNADGATATTSYRGTLAPLATVQTTNGVKSSFVAARSSLWGFSLVLGGMFAGVYLVL